MIKLTKEQKQKVKKEYGKLVMRMLLTDNPEELKLLRERCQTLSEMVETKWKISPDTVLLAIVNLVGIGMVLWHEKLDVISSKAFGFIMKGRI